MKLAVVIAVAALGLTGAATAQAIQGVERGGGVLPKDGFGAPPVQELGSHWTNPQLWDGYDDPSRPAGRDQTPLPSDFQTKMTQQVAEGLKVAVPQMRQACAVDRGSLCADKKSDLSADRCLEYYRLKVSRPCRQAWDKLAMAAEGRL